MNNKDNLQNAFEKAFEEHQAPLNQAQWDRLDAALLRKKNKRRFLPWIFTLIAVTIFSVGFGYWLGNKSVKNENSNQQISSNHNITDKSRSVDDQSFKSQSKPLVQNDSTPMASSENITKAVSQPSTNKHSDIKSITERKNKIARAIRAKNSRNPIIEQPKLTFEDPKVHIEKPKLPTEETKDGYYPKANPDNITIVDGTKPLKIIDAPISKSSEELADSLLNNAKDSSLKDGDDPKKHVKRFAIGLTGGISNAVFKNTTFTEPSKMHEDTKQVYNENVKQTKSQYLNLFFDFKILKNVNLTLNSGIQYRQIEINENNNYTLYKVPFRNQDGSIAAYIKFPMIVPSQDTNKKWDTLNPMTFSYSNKIGIRFVSIPVAFSYTLPLSSKSELQLTAGIILNKIAFAKGKTFSLNTAQLLNYKEVLNKKGNMGYLAGVSYYRNLYKPWWIGLGAQIQQNKVMINSGGYGFIKSNINITNYSLNLKYKF